MDCLPAHIILLILIITTVSDNALCENQDGKHTSTHTEEINTDTSIRLTYQHESNVLFPDQLYQATLAKKAQLQVVKIENGQSPDQKVHHYLETVETVDNGTTKSVHKLKFPPEAEPVKPLVINPIYTNDVNLTKEDGLFCSYDPYSLKYAYMFNTIQSNGRFQGYETMAGAKLNIDDQLLDGLGFPMTNEKFITLNDTTVRDFVFLLAARSDNFNQCIDAISLVHKHYPKKTIVFYDLGLNEQQKREISLLCNTKVKTFNYSKNYPEFVRNSSAKSLMIYETLKTYPGIFWLNSSVGLSAPDVKQWEKLYHNLIHESNGMMLLKTGSNKEPLVLKDATNPKMTKFLKSLESSLKNQTLYRTDAMILYRTKEVYNNILHWLTLCALDQRCSEERCAKNSEECPMDKFEHTAINILMNNYRQFDETKFVTDSNLVFLRKDQADDYKSYLCHKDSSHNEDKEKQQ